LPAAVRAAAGGTLEIILHIRTFPIRRRGRLHRHRTHPALIRLGLPGHRIRRRRSEIRIHQHKNRRIPVQRHPRGIRRINIILLFGIGQRQPAALPVHHHTSCITIRQRTDTAASGKICLRHIIKTIPRRCHRRNPPALKNPVSQIRIVLRPGILTGALIHRTRISIIQTPHIARINHLTGNRLIPMSQPRHKSIGPAAPLRRRITVRQQILRRRLQPVITPVNPRRRNPVGRVKMSPNLLPALIGRRRIVQRNHRQQAVAAPHNLMRIFIIHRLLKNIIQNRDSAVIRNAADNHFPVFIPPVRRTQIRIHRIRRSTPIATVIIPSHRHRPRIRMRIADQQHIQNVFRNII